MFRKLEAKDVKQPKYSDSFVVRSDKGLTLETSALKLSTVASLRY